MEVGGIWDSWMEEVHSTPVKLLQRHTVSVDVLVICVIVVLKHCTGMMVLQLTVPLHIGVCMRQLEV